MKHNFRIAMFFIAATFITLQSCNKDKSIVDEAQIDPTEQKILNFKKQMQNPNKSSETMSIDSAVWYIEAALNYTHCNAEVKQISELDTFFITVNITEAGEVNFNEIIDIYTQLNAYLINIVGEETLIVADIEHIVTRNKSDEENIMLVVARAPGVVPLPNEFYNITDTWYAGHDLGNCSGTVQNWALDNEINKWLSRNRAVMQNVYYTNVAHNRFYSYSWEEVDMYDYDSQWNNIYHGYDNIELYTKVDPVIGACPSSEEIFGECVSTTRANFYARETNQAIDYIQQYKMPTYDHRVAGWNVEEDFCVREHSNPDNNEWYGKHHIYITSGIPHYIGEIK